MNKLILHPDGRVEGTPEEIAQWKEFKEKYDKEFSKPSSEGINQYTCPPWMNDLTLRNYPKGKYPNEGNSCYCTGACNR